MDALLEGLGAARLAAAQRETALATRWLGYTVAWWPKKPLQTCRFVVKCRPVSGLQRHADADRTLPNPLVFVCYAVNGLRCAPEMKITIKS